MDIIKIFQTVRDIPYRIPLTLDEKDECCSGKHKLLKERLEEQGYQVRYRVGSFQWSSMNLPKEVAIIPHDNECTHVWLEVFVNNNWITVDATWDSGLKDIFDINEWDGQTDTKIAVEVIKKFTLQESQDIIDNEKTDLLEDLKVNGAFYQAFNKWLNR